ncbi:tetratricopeptide repeat protein, partial [Anabaena sp. UHCC 0204]
MVSIEEILKRVQQAETETERQWILLELQMSQMSDELVSILWAAAIPHFFDANILAALRPELAEQAEKLYENLTALTFVEKFPKQGYNIHELTRNVLLNQLWQQDKDEFLSLSQRAADYFFAEKMSSEEDVEFCYHEILNEGKAQTGRLLDRGINWWTYHQIERMQAAVQSFLEYEIAGRLDTFGKGFSLHLQGLIEMRSGHSVKAESFLSRAETLYQEINLKNPRYITTLLRDIGNLKKDQGDYASAVDFYKKALSISEEQLGENHPDTAVSLNNLAGLYQIKGRYE